MNTAWDGVTGAVTGLSARQLHTFSPFFSYGHFLTIKLSLSAVAGFPLNT